MPTAREKQCLFVFKPADKTADGIPILAFLLPEAAWDYMRNGLGHAFDLTNIGIPLKVVIGRTKDHKTGMAELRKAGLLAEETVDARDVDVDFKERTKQ